MLKRIIPWILLVIAIGAGVFGTVKFYKENKANIAALNNANSLNASMRSELDAIGTMVDVYALSTDVISGGEIADTDFITVSVPEKSIGATVVRVGATTTDEEGNEVPATDEFVGRHYRCNYSKGTLLTNEMLMTDDEEAEGMHKFPIELTFTSLPVTLAEGDYIDLRFFMSSGEEYTVLDHKIVRAIYNNTISLWVNEEEMAILNSMSSDLATYPDVCVAYVMKYLEPGNSETVSFYPVLSELEAFLMYNPNITDTTRCINSELRNYINQQLMILSDSANSGVSNSIISYINNTLASQSAARQQYVQEQEQKANEEAQAGATSETGEVPVEGEEVPVEEAIDTEAIE